jgi:hypothetical protein
MCTALVYNSKKKHDERGKKDPCMEDMHALVYIFPREKKNSMSSQSPIFLCI